MAYSLVTLGFISLCPRTFAIIRKSAKSPLILSVTNALSIFIEVDCNFMVREKCLDSSAYISTEPTSDRRHINSSYD